MWHKSFPVFTGILIIAVVFCLTLIRKLSWVVKCRGRLIGKRILLAALGFLVRIIMLNCHGKAGKTEDNDALLFYFVRDDLIFLVCLEQFAVGTILLLSVLVCIHIIIMLYH